MDLIGSSVPYALHARYVPALADLHDWSWGDEAEGRILERCPSSAVQHATYRQRLHRNEGTSALGAERKPMSFK